MRSCLRRAKIILHNAKTRHQFFPVNKKTPEHLESIIKVFSEHEAKINSHKHRLTSNSVLGVLRKNLEAVGFRIESGKKKEEKIKMPVLFGENSQIIKSFDVDGYHEDSKTVLEVEAGRGFLNNQFLKDFFDSMYASGRMNIPLKGLLIIGY